jgi:vesicle-fusing ATPase
MAENNYLSHDVNLDDIAEQTKNFSGAELEGLVKSASSFALNRQVKDLNNLTKIDHTKMKVIPDDFTRALEEVKPAFGVSTDEFEAYMHQGLIDYGRRFEQLFNSCKSFVRQVETSSRYDLLSVLLEGEIGTGKTTLAAHLAVDSGFPYVKIISSEKLVGYSEQGICNNITKVFSDAYKSPLSIIVLDNIERLIQYVNIGPRFSNTILQALLVLIKKPPPPGKKLLVIGTTSMKSKLEDMELIDAFNVTVSVPLLSDKKDIKKVMVSSACFDEKRDDKLMDQCLQVVPHAIGIKKLLLVIEMAASRTDMDGDQPDQIESQEDKNKLRPITFQKFVQSLRDCGVELDDE